MALKLSRPAALTLICAGLSLAWHAFFLPVNQAALHRWHPSDRHVPPGRQLLAAALCVAQPPAGLGSRPWAGGLGAAGLSLGGLARDLPSGRRGPPPVWRTRRVVGDDRLDRFADGPALEPASHDRHDRHGTYDRFAGRPAGGGRSLPARSFPQGERSARAAPSLLGQPVARSRIDPGPAGHADAISGRAFAAAICCGRVGFGPHAPRDAGPLVSSGADAVALALPSRVAAREHSTNPETTPTRSLSATLSEISAKP